MGDRKPFTLKERRRWCQSFGHRPVNNWGDGDLPAPFAEGDVVELVGEPHDRLYGMTGPFFVVTYACSIDEGDGWYFRVYDGSSERGSDRLHVVYAERAEADWEASVDWMAPFELHETIDPVGLNLRRRLLAEGWSYTGRTRCEACGHRFPVPGGESNG